MEAQYTGLQADGHFTVANTLQDAKFSPRSGVTGSGYCPDATGHCFVHFGGPQPSKPNYKVIETDYTSYSIVYSCGFVSAKLWLLTREPIVADTLINTMLATAKKNLPHFDFTTMDARDYQGSKCSYSKPVQEGFFLQ